MTPETLTPRTDAAEILWNDTGLFVVPADFARQLERELAAKDAHADEIYKAAVSLAAKLEADLATERELADRLADHLDTALGAFDNQEAPHVVRANRALAAWKESRK